MTPLETSQAMYDCLHHGDWDGVEAFMAEDFVIHEPASLPYGGEWRGKDALKRLYAHVMGYWEDPDVEWDELIGGERFAAALLRFTMTSRATGERFHQTVSEVTRFDDQGKMAEMRVHYFDAAEVARQAGG